MQIKQYTPTTHKINAVIYGGSGTGKTTFGNTAPKPIFASAEGGLLSLGNSGTAYVDIKSVSDLKELLKYLQVTPDHGFETVIIDSITEINEICKVAIEQKTGKPMGLQDWGTLSKTIRDILRGFRDLNMHTIFIAQETAQKDGDKVEKYVPSLNGKAADEIAYFMDVVGYIFLDPNTGERKIITNPSPKLLTKDRTGKIGNTTELNFSKWVELASSMVIGEQKILLDTDKEEMVSDDQLETIEGLLNQIRKENKKPIAELRKATAGMVKKETLDSLTATEAKKIIEALEKKLEKTEPSEAPTEPETPPNVKAVREFLEKAKAEEKQVTFEFKADPFGPDYTEEMATEDIISLLA